MDETNRERRDPNARHGDRGRGTATDGRPYVLVLAVAPWTASARHPEPVMAPAPSTA